MTENNGVSEQRDSLPRHRSLTRRIIVTAELVLTSPANFGNGDADSATDMPLITDEVDGRALITGASLAGALRNYLREYELGYDAWHPPKDPQSDGYEDALWFERNYLATILFGGHRGDPKGEQSPLIVDDALSLAEGHAAVELRDGVALDPKTRTAQERKKYDYQLLPAGTRFKLNFELLLDEQESEMADARNAARKRALALALTGLAKGEIRLGARKRRGFGCCTVKQWTVTEYDLTRPDELLAWLASDYPEWGLAGRVASGEEIAPLLGVDLKVERPRDLREEFVIEACFTIAGSLLVRSGFNDQFQGPDVAHLLTNNPANNQKMSPVLPGTSMAGALRQRALRIAQTLAGRDEAATTSGRRFVAGMFGPTEIKSGDQSYASRVLINEEFIDKTQAWVQTRIKIDRFTGGTMEGALLDEVPQFGGEVKLCLALRNPTQAEIGLLMLVLKDLWLGDLPIGGEAGVGRGRLRGVKAELHWKRRKLEITGTDGDGGLSFSDPAMAISLEACVNELAHRSWLEAKNERI